MTIHQQQKRVQRLSRLAAAKKSEVADHRRALKRWRRRVFGGTGALAWSFAAGAWWTVRQDSINPASTLRKTAVAAANVSFFLWRAASYRPAMEEQAK